MPPSRTSVDAAEEIVDRVAARARGAREGLFGPESMVWQVARENVLFMGAPRALLLQLAHPAVLSGVLQHSQVASDPLGRSVRTFEAMYTLTLGDLDSALRVVRTVWRRHQVVRGSVLQETKSSEAGAAYHATDPRLMLWVWSTLHDTSMRMFEMFVRPLSTAERVRLHEEGKLVQLAFGIPEPHIPPTPQDFDAYMASMLDGPVLDVPRAARAEWELLLRQPPSGGLVGALMIPNLRTVNRLIDGSPARRLGPAVARLLAAGTLPPRLREGYGLRWGASDAALFKVLVEATRRSVRLLPRHLRFHAAYRHAMDRLSPKRAA